MRGKKKAISRDTTLFSIQLHISIAGLFDTCLEHSPALLLFCNVSPMTSSSRDYDCVVAWYYMLVCPVFGTFLKIEVEDNVLVWF